MVCGRDSTARIRGRVSCMYHVSCIMYHVCITLDICIDMHGGCGKVYVVGASKRAHHILQSGERIINHKVKQRTVSDLK